MTTHGRRRGSFATLLVASAVLVACGDEQSTSRAHAPQHHRQPERQPHERISALAPAHRPSPAATLTCDSSPSIIRDASWRNRSVVVEHVVFSEARGLAQQPKAAFWPIERVLRMRIQDTRASRREMEGSKKLLAKVQPRTYGIAELHISVQRGHRAVVAVPERDQSVVSLVYTARARDRGGQHAFFKISDGNGVLAFTGCPDGSSDHQGGVVVAGARCVRFLVYGDTAEQPIVAPIGFGRPCSTN